jgi:hypothetical protein
MFTAFGTPSSQDVPDLPAISTNNHSSYLVFATSVLGLPTEWPTNPSLQAAASNSNLRWFMSTQPSFKPLTTRCFRALFVFLLRLDRQKTPFVEAARRKPRREEGGVWDAAMTQL